MAMTETDKKEIKELISDGFKSQKEWLEATINPIQKNIDNHDETIKEVPIIKQRLDSHIETHNSAENNKKFNTEMWIIVGVFILDKVYQFLSM